jgi:peptidoglycan hydrolase-like protein with peptidoglycan-binding domain
MKKATGVKLIPDNKVLQIQQKLNKLQIRKLDENGISNEETINTIKLLQGITGFQQNGIIDQNLTFRIDEILSMPTISVNDKSKTFAIMFVKYKLGLDINNKADKEFIEKVNQFKERHNLQTDGVFDYLAWIELLKEKQEEVFE